MQQLRRVPAPLFYHYLQQDLQAALAQGNQDYKTSLSLSQPAKEELTWWQDQLPKWNGKPLRQCQGQIVMQSDASLSGWGAVCGKTRTGGPVINLKVGVLLDHGVSQLFIPHPALQTPSKQRITNVRSVPALTQVLH